MPVMLTYTRSAEQESLFQLVFPRSYKDFSFATEGKACSVSK